MYITKKKILWNKHLELFLFGKNYYSDKFTDDNEFDFNLGFEINQHFIKLDLILVGLAFWWKL